MFKNYLKIALRNLRKYKSYSFINITGLAVGMACTMLILMWVQHEISYDRFNENADDIYRVVENQYYAGGEIFPVAVTPSPLAPALKEQFPEIIKATRFSFRTLTIKKDDKIFSEGVAVADPDIFDIFTIPFVKGSPETALSEPHSLVLTEEAAAKYFGEQEALGQVLQIDHRHDFRVTGVIKNIPDNSHLKYDMLAPFIYLQELGSSLEYWGNNWCYTYVRLQKNTPYREVDKKIIDLIKKNNENSATDIYLQPLTKIHLYSSGKYTADIGGHGDIQYVEIFSAIALFVLLIACINFMNLATARSERRAKEVGLRKVVGARRAQLIRQFFGEAIILSLIAFKGGKGTHTGGSLFRKVLVVLQFALSVIMIIGTLVISRQMDFIRNKNLGLDKENLGYIWMSGEFRTKSAIARQELLRNPSITRITRTNQLPTRVVRSSSGWEWQGRYPADDVLMHILSVDEDYVQTFKMEMAQGRFFSRAFPADSQAVVINQRAAEVMGMQAPVGKRLSAGSNDFTIIGVVKDFHFKPIRTKIEPLLMFLRPNAYYAMVLRTRPENIAATIEFVEKTYKKFNADTPFYFNFLDEDYDRLYRAEQRVGKLSGYFAIIAILIASLGLYGLASYTAEQRTKEIGIRKVPGASVGSLFALLSRSFVLLAAIANLIAWPVAYFIATGWLQNFAYRIEIGWPREITALHFVKLIAQDPTTGLYFFFSEIFISRGWWVFALAGGLALVIALLTVSTQAIRAALANPVESLRYE